MTDCQRLQNMVSVGLLQTIVLLVIALIMIGFGHSFSDDWNNGVTNFLVIGGWISFALSILTAIVSGPMKEESCVLGLYTYTAHTHMYSSRWSPLWS